MGRPSRCLSISLCLAYDNINNHNHNAEITSVIIPRFYAQVENTAMIDRYTSERLPTSISDGHGSGVVCKGSTWMLPSKRIYAVINIDLSQLTEILHLRSSLI